MLSYGISVLKSFNRRIKCNILVLKMSTLLKDFFIFAEKSLDRVFALRETLGPRDA